MAKKGRRALGGGGAAGGARRPPPATRGRASDFVVVNPALMQSMGGSGAKHKVAPSPKPKHKQKQKNNHPQAKSPKNPENAASKKRDAAAHGGGAPRPAKKHKSSQSKQVEPIAITNAALVDSSSTAPERSLLMVAREDEWLAGAYWVLLTRTRKRSSVVAIPNAHATLPSSPALARMLRSLGFQALAIHGRMTTAQRRQNVQRLRDAATNADGSGAVLVLVTTQHLLPSATSVAADLIVLGDTSAPHMLTLRGKFAHTYTVTTSIASTTTAEPAYAVPLSATAMPQLQARIKLATQIVAIADRVGDASTQDADAKWANKLARRADLGSDDDDETKSDGKATNSEQQRLRALTDKLCVLLAHPITRASPEEPALATMGGGKTATAAAVVPANDAQHRAAKLRVLGLVSLNAAVTTSLGGGDEQRLSAQTQWLDAAPGSRFGGEWMGTVRHGASKDAASLALRQRYCASLSATNTNNINNNNDPSAGRFLARWRPNAEPSDTSAWGGAYGKPCAHNEVVLQQLRPFAPQEVLNSRVCSRRLPAPGNQGFDGCLEFLRLSCLAQRHALTVWDAENFLFTTAQGQVSATHKGALLQLPLAGLQCLMQNLRTWTLCSQGQRHPNALLLAIQLCCRLALGQHRDQTTRTRTSSRSSSNGEHLADQRVRKRVMAFAIGGSARVWQQIARLQLPLETEILYTSE